jgi:hypothetical protein
MAFRSCSTEATCWTGLGAIPSSLLRLLLQGPEVKGLAGMQGCACCLEKEGSLQNSVKFKHAVSSAKAACNATTTFW